MEDLLTVLNRRHPPAGKTVAIATAIDEVDNRRVEITASQKIRVQGMRDAIARYRGIGRLERLTQHLTTVNLRAAYVATGTTKNIGLELFKFQQALQGSEALIHEWRGPELRARDP